MIESFKDLLGSRQEDDNRGSFFKFNPKMISRLAAESPSAGAKATFKGNCSIGAFSYVGMDSTVTAADIGRYCSIAPGVVIGPSEHPIDYFSTHPFASGLNGPFNDSDDYQDIAADRRKVAMPRTVIGSDVWIGQNVVIRRGVTVGHGAVIGAQAFVGKDVEPYAIVGGVPARFIRWRFDEEIRKRMLAVKWWEYDLKPLKSKVDFKKPAKALDLIEAMIAGGELRPFTPKIAVIGKDAA